MWQSQNQDDTPTEGENPKRSRKRLIWIVIAIVVVVIAIIVVVSVLTLTRSGGSDKAKLGDILPKSFSAGFILQKQGTEEEKKIKIEWDLDAGKIRYMETDRNQEKILRDMMTINKLSHSIGPENLMNITIVSNEAVLNVFNADSGNWTWSCIPTSDTVPFYQVIQFAPIATKTTDEKMVECNGSVWSYCSGCVVCSPIFYCEKDLSIVLIKQNNMTVTLLNWTVPATNVIQLPEQNVSCKEIRSLYQNYERLQINEFSSAENKSRDKYIPLRHTASAKTCLFIHGAGEAGPKTGYKVETSQKDYWGNVQTYVSRCVTKKFIHFDTINRGWDDNDLQRSFCSFAISPEGSTYISNKIIYAHSMGNLIIAAALHHNVCKFDNTTEWYSVQGPWHGSRTADWLDVGCRYQITLVFGLLDPLLLLNFLKFTHYCTWKGTPSRAYETLKTNYRSADGTTFTDLITVGNKYVSGILCGDSSWGMGKNWIYSSALFAIQFVTFLPNPNDGMVNFNPSCALDNVGRFTTKYKSRFYRSYANHAEGTCKFGDANFCPFWWNRDKTHPCRWYGS